MASVAQLPIRLDPEAIADFCRRNHIRKLSLFGSVLRDDFRPDSDVDVLVEFEPEADGEIGLFELADMEEQLSEILHREVDLGERLRPEIEARVLKEALVIYATAE